MTRENLTALIDRVIGSKGILRTPSYWMRKVLNNMTDYLEGYADSASQSVKVKVDTAMSDTSSNPVQNKVIKAYVDGAVKTKQDTISDLATIRKGASDGTAARTEVQSLSAEVQSLSAEVQSLSAEVQSLSAEVQSLSAEVQSLSAEVQSLSAEVQSLSAEIVANEAVAAAAFSDLDARIIDIVARLNSAGL